jgi:2,4-dienoyl-CoA reductase-like NADH-dependent reductase (Old Yellow Enzyme family)
MTAPNLFDPLTFLHGPSLKNRFVLAPLTNQQSHPDGRLSDEEFRWLTIRAQGGFGLTMTCAAHVQAIGQGFPGQLGIFSDIHLEGLTRLASAIKAAGSVAVVQIHHAGERAAASLISEPVAPSANPEFNARELSLAEVEQLVDDFVAAGVRAQKAGFDGVEVHGAHGYIVCAFQSAATNRRTDRYGGSWENRNRLLWEILAGLRQRCGPDFQIGVRLSPERHGLLLAEQRDTVQALMSAKAVDYIDMSIWDVNKQPVEEDFQGRTLMSYFTELDRGEVRLGAAGKIMTAKTAQAVLEAGNDFVVIGRGAILHHDFPLRARDAAFEPIALPVTREHLASEGLSPDFISYMNNWKGFVAA